VDVVTVALVADVAGGRVVTAAGSFAATWRPDPLVAARGRVVTGLEPVRSLLVEWGVPEPDWSGKLIRPLLGYAAAGGRSGAADAPSGLWQALGSVQVAHEASLLHDDVIDGAAERRGERTVAAARGVAAAIVEGDHLLTAAYRLAAATGNVDWTDLFARAVERTVAGEKSQARSAGRVLEWAEYEAIVLGKSGELLGAALAAGPILRGDWSAHQYYELGRRVGLVYQMLDDLLDYCPQVGTGKPSLSDYARGLWTWPLQYVDIPAGLEHDEVAARLRQPDAAGITPIQRCVDRFRTEALAVVSQADELLPGDPILPALLGQWLELADSALPPVSAPVVALPPVDGWRDAMAERARSFQFASRLFPAEHRDGIALVYAWCRYTDDLVDGVDLPRPELEARLDAWLNLCHRAYDGEVTGNELADRAMTAMRDASVPFGYAAELIEGMRMDVRGTGYGTLAELRSYTFRVASVVGLWLTESFGIRDPWMLDRAAALGHAMQLTNILRDVGEDLRAGRVYIPSTWLAAYGLTRADLEAMADTGEISEEYRRLMEALLDVADSEYDHAAAAIDRLPDFFRRPVAVAAAVYRGIHDRLRQNGYDNLTRRAHTTLPDKIRLGASALWRSQREPRRYWRRLAASLALPGLVALALWASPACGQDAPVTGPSPAAEVPAAGTGTGAAAGAAVVRPDTAPVVAEATVPWRVVEEVGELWVRAVEESSAVAAGLDAVARARLDVTPEAAAAGSANGAEVERLLTAFEGSFLALRARHGGWPRERLRWLRQGFDRMDAAVAAGPGMAEVRYIRLMSGFYLPGFLGRGDGVRSDLDALASLLPASRDRFPASLYPEVVRFVLEHAELDHDARRDLESALQ
jgi:15-cis-phytoene synthase